MVKAAPVTSLSLLSKKKPGHQCRFEAEHRHVKCSPCRQMLLSSREPEAPGNLLKMDLPKWCPRRRVEEAKQLVTEVVEDRHYLLDELSRWHA